ncbi:MAG: hypothetical protein IKA42_06355 [Clostridia bacterium]|nr:hypothetical protein [Clostridia bacterium]
MIKSKKNLIIIISLVVALLVMGGILTVILINNCKANKIPGEYADLYDALQNAETGDTVYMTENLSCNREVFVNKSIAIDLGGKVLKSIEDFEIGEGATLTLTNGTVKPTKEFVVKGNLVVGKGAEIVFGENCLFGTLGSKVKIDGGRISSVNQTIETQGDFEMTSGNVNRITVYGNLLISGGYVDSCSNYGEGVITGGSFGSTNISDPLRNYGALLKIEGSQSQPIQITSNAEGLYTSKGSKTTIKNANIDSTVNDISALGAIDVEGLILHGVTVLGGESHFKNCTITSWENAESAISNQSEKLILENCTVTGNTYGVTNFAGGKLVVKQSEITADAWAIVNNSMTDDIGNFLQGVVEIESGFVAGIENKTDSKLFVKGGVISHYQDQELAIRSYSNSSNTEIVISGGSIQGSILCTKGKVVVSGGTIKGEGDFYGICSSGADLEVSGGTIEGKWAIIVYSNGKTTLSGGIFKGGAMIERMYFDPTYATVLSDLLADGCRFESEQDINTLLNYTEANFSIVWQ